LNFEKINKILDSYLEKKKQEVDRTRQKTTILNVFSEGANVIFEGMKSEDKPTSRKTNDFIRPKENSLGKASTIRDAGVLGKAGLIKKKKTDILSDLENEVAKVELKQHNSNIFGSLFSLAQVKKESVAGKQQYYMVNRRTEEQLLEVQEVISQAHKASDVALEKLSKQWYLALFFTVNDFVIALLPVIQLEYFKSGELPINFYIICEFLNVVALMDPIVTFRTNKKVFQRTMTMFKLYTTISLIVLSNVLSFSKIPLESTEIKVLNFLM
jgi:hypothetical protein